MPTHVIMTIVWRADLDSKPKAGFHIKSISILSKFDLYVCGEGGVIGSTSYDEPRGYRLCTQGIHNNSLSIIP